ncbi:OmpA family protein [Hymenobacter properus]|uniref:OmpA family protein n=1 Tax=Hymenobacter properus TaxID=2791026 RepID=A0A931FJI5_9BACT|nr:OmpA family protein [Hymenobacter properus]MBF9143022.1 OmpA family protein [Hymenobacter properus]MBR7721830.1 OmpA family protein [Microvirga sp. SRT04]
MKRFTTSLSVFMVLAAGPVLAQVAPMSLTGNVQSDDRRALSGAAITVIHVPSGTRYAAASNASGRFVISNLQAGGPYLMQVGEGGFNSQTLESIFLENGKTANFTVTLSRLTSAKNRAGRDDKAAPEAAVTESLAPESVVGGPVYITTRTGGTGSSSSAAMSAGTTSAGGATRAASPPAAAPPAAAHAPAAARYRRYPSTRSTGPKKAHDPVVPGHFDAKTGDYVYETGALTTLKLADGGTISGVGINSTESNLYRFLTNPAAQVDTMDLTNGWYNFDRVFFTPGKATLTPESMGQLRNIASLLRAYPTARIKLGGYTDSTGTYKVNKQLSEARARTAWASLVDMGISPSRIEARGYGRNYAIAPNTTEVGRARNRRLSVKVLQK